jgi:protein involved in polysaccharide export with SLBB domain
MTAGDRSDNLLLQEQDVIRIPYYEGKVILSGYVKRPGIYELVTGESFEKLFSYAGKFSDSAFRKSVTVYQINDERLAIKTLPSEEFSSYIPKTADSVVIGTATMRFANRVSIKGAVLRPGDYELVPGMELKNLIEKAGGLREDAFLEGGNILRIGDDLGPENVSFSPAMILNGKESITLKRDDEVLLTSKFEIREKYTVNIEGEVTRPGQFEWRKDLKVRDLVLLAGGISEAASSAGEIHIEVSRRIRRAYTSPTDINQSEIMRITTTRSLSDSQAAMVLEPFDIIVVRPQPGYQPQKSVFINGPILYPGRYFLEKSGERITDVLIRAGQFKSSADSSSVFIKRFNNKEVDPDERTALLAKLSNIPADSIMSSPTLVKEIQKNYTSLSVNLKKAFENRGGNDDLILEPGDIIQVSQNSSLVRVSGEVYYPTLIPYEDNTNINYYIKRTGDYTKAARKNQTFVIYPNGMAKGVKKFLFIKSYPKVTPRSEIFVPSKGEKGRPGLSTGEWVAISSILATITTLIVSVINAN